jgi:hypothetical protein
MDPYQHSHTGLAVERFGSFPTIKYYNKMSTFPFFWSSVLSVSDNGGALQEAVSSSSLHEEEQEVSVSPSSETQLNLSTPCSPAYSRSVVKNRSEAHPELSDLFVGYPLLQPSPISDANSKSNKGHPAADSPFSNRTLALGAKERPVARVVPSRDRIQQKKKRVAEMQEGEYTTVGALLEAEDTAFTSEDESCFVSESFSQQGVDHSSILKLFFTYKKL